MQRTKDLGQTHTGPLILGSATVSSYESLSVDNEGCFPLVSLTPLASTILQFLPNFCKIPKLCLMFDYGSLPNKNINLAFLVNFFVIFVLSV